MAAPSGRCSSTWAWGTEPSALPLSPIQASSSPAAHPDPGSDAGGEPPRAVVGTVVGARRVVVDVVEVVLPPLVVADHDAEAGRRVVEHPVDDAVVHRQQRLQAVADQVVALVRPGAAVAAGAPVVDSRSPARRRGT